MLLNSQMANKQDLTSEHKVSADKISTTPAKLGKCNSKLNIS